MRRHGFGARRCRSGVLVRRLHTPWASEQAGLGIPEWPIQRAPENGRRTAKADEVEAGQRVYTPFTLRGSTTSSSSGSRIASSGDVPAPRCSSGTRVTSARATSTSGSAPVVLDHCSWPVERPQITLLDLNENSLSAASDRIRRYAPATVQANVLDPVDLGDARFDSIGANFLFHCLPGELEGKAATVASNLRPYLASGGVLFGSTILGRGVSHNLLGRRLMRLYNRKRIFSNLEDDQRGLERGLASELTDVEIEVVGAVALFAGRA